MLRTLLLGSRILRVVAALSLGGIGIASLAGGCGSEASGDNGAPAGGDGGPDGSSSSGASGASGSSGASSSNGSSGSSGASSSSGSSGASGGTSSGVPNVEFVYEDIPRDSGLTQDSACAQTSATAGLRPLDMFVMLDHSISMGNDCTIGQTTASRWCRSINALSTYLKSPSSANNAAALNFFGNNNVCNGTSYDFSVVPGGDTGYRDLPSNTFDTPLNAEGPDGYTPLQGGVQGIIEFTKRPENRRAGRETIGVLITDADTGTLQCANGNINTHINSLRDQLAAHRTATGVRTYVIGMTGADFGVLETLAGGGGAATHNSTVGAVTNACGNGSTTCKHWNVGDGTNNALAAALQAIQGAAIGCSYTMPTSSTGVINPNNVNVEYLVNGAAPGQALTKVQNAAACVANGWYYDNNAAPTTIQLCPQQCTTVQADPGAKINVLLGCLGG